MQRKERYKITNMTVKPPRIVDGKDTRDIGEKVGHSVMFRDENDRTTVLTQGRSVIVNDLLPGLIEMQRGGFIKIEPITDIAAALKEHSLQAEEERLAKKKAAEVKKTDPRKARAVEMGKDTYDQKGGSEHDDAVNPSGDPNFLAKATSKKKKRGVNNALSTESGSNTAV